MRVWRWRLCGCLRSRAVWGELHSYDHQLIRVLKREDLAYGSVEEPYFGGKCILAGRSRPGRFQPVLQRLNVYLHRLLFLRFSIVLMFISIPDNWRDYTVLSCVATASEGPCNKPFRIEFSDLLSPIPECLQNLSIRARAFK